MIFESKWCSRKVSSKSSRIGRQLSWAQPCSLTLIHRWSATSSSIFSIKRPQSSRYWAICETITTRIPSSIAKGPLTSQNINRSRNAPLAGINLPAAGRWSTARSAACLMTRSVWSGPGTTPCLPSIRTLNYTQHAALSASCASTSSTCMKRCVKQLRPSMVPKYRLHTICESYSRRVQMPRMSCIGRKITKISLSKRSRMLNKPT